MKQKRIYTRGYVALAVGMSLTLLVAPCGIGTAQAKSGGGSTVDIANTVHSHNQGQKSQHSSRKMAAKRLRAEYQKNHQQKLHDWAKAHQGYTGHGQTGNGGAK